MSKSRSRRLRKKLHLDEFQQLGFEISFSLPENLDSEKLDDFFDQFITEAIENNDLWFGGGIGGNSGGFVTLERKSATEEHRERVKSWLSAHPMVADIQIGELVDAWYGHDE
ncbi:MAG: hypothetical protein ABS69_01445 [Nitrosomonadales bacterium SCN 54-20]|nr:MAG: hypothetical protein ABS69_01445 [Nitrosomonadales bacterium SCN 54-20]